MTHSDLDVVWHRQSTYYNVQYLGGEKEPGGNPHGHWENIERSITLTVFTGPIRLQRYPLRHPPNQNIYIVTALTVL